jgi:flagellar hook-associated protein 3 FlgL
MRISTSLLQQQGINAITDLSAQAADTQQKIATGRRVRTPADDPAGAGAIIRLNQQLASRERYLENADRAEAALEQEETVLFRITEVLQRVRELTLQAGDPAFGPDDRAYLGAELSVRFDELLDLVNSRDAEGQYLFSGFRGDVRPFAFENGSIRYQGDSGQRELAIDRDRMLAISDSGASLFAGAAVDFPTIAVLANRDGSPGAAPPSLTANVIDSEALAEVAARRIQVSVDEVDGLTVLAFRNADDGTLIDGAQAVPYGPTVALAEAGLQLDFTEPPAPGDQFLLEISSQQGLLTTVNNIAATLSGTTGQVGGAVTDEVLRERIDQTLVGLDQALDNILGTQSSLGARLNAIDSTRTLHEDIVLKTQGLLSDVQDIDFAEAVSELNFQSFVLEAAQQSFIRVSRLSLFNSL